MAGRPPTGDPVLRARRSGRGGRTRRRRRRAGRRGLRAHAVRPGRRGSRLHRGAGRAAGGEAAVVQPRRERRDPPAAMTAWQGLFDHGRLAAGERVLIHGAAGAVGGLAVQLARTRHAYVVGTAAAAELGLVRELGAQEAIDSATGFEDAVAPVDLVFDTVGGERLRRSGAVLRPG